MNYRNSLPTLFAIHTMTFYRVEPYLIGHVTAFITKSLMEKGFKFSSVSILLCNVHDKSTLDAGQRF